MVNENVKGSILMSLLHYHEPEVYNSNSFNHQESSRKYLERTFPKWKIEHNSATTVLGHPDNNENKITTVYYKTFFNANGSYGGNAQFLSDAKDAILILAHGKSGLLDSLKKDSFDVKISFSEMPRDIESQTLPAFMELLKSKQDPNGFEYEFSKDVPMGIKFSVPLGEIPVKYEKVSKMLNF